MATTQDLLRHPFLVHMTRSEKAISSLCGEEHPELAFCSDWALKHMPNSLCPACQRIAESELILKSLCASSGVATQRRQTSAASSRRMRIRQFNALRKQNNSWSGLKRVATRVLFPQDEARRLPSAAILETVAGKLITA